MTNDNGTEHSLHITCFTMISQSICKAELCLANSQNLKNKLTTWSMKQSTMRTVRCRSIAMRSYIIMWNNSLYVTSPILDMFLWRFVVMLKSCFIVVCETITPENIGIPSSWSFGWSWVFANNYISEKLKNMLTHRLSNTMLLLGISDLTFGNKWKPSEITGFQLQCIESIPLENN